MASEEVLDVPRKFFRYLLNGYYLVVFGVFLSVLDLAGSFSPGGFGPIATGVALFINSFAFLVVVYSHVWYLKKRGYLSVLDKEVFGVPVKYVVTSVAAIVITLGNFAFVLNDSIYDTSAITVGEANSILTVVGIVFLVILVLITLSMIYFNFLFALAGPIYLILFYYLVVRE